MLFVVDTLLQIIIVVHFVVLLEMVYLFPCTIMVPVYHLNYTPIIVIILINQVVQVVYVIFFVVVALVVVTNVDVSVLILVLLFLILALLLVPVYHLKTLLL